MSLSLIRTNIMLLLLFSLIFGCNNRVNYCEKFLIISNENYDFFIKNHKKFYSCENLSFLRIDKDKLDESLKKLLNSNSLKVLRISLVDLDTLPKIISQFNKLETLEITRCNLSTVPRSFSKFSSLKKLKISNNRLQNIPYIKSLESLDLTDNVIEILPYKYLNSENLKYLYLDNNKLKTIKTNDIYKNNLLILSISGNKLSNSKIKSLSAILGDSVVVTSKPVVE